MQPGQHPGRSILRERQRAKSLGRAQKIQRAQSTSKVYLDGEGKLSRRSLDSEPQTELSSEDKARRQLKKRSSGGGSLFIIETPPRHRGSDSEEKKFRRQQSKRGSGTLNDQSKRGSWQTVDETPPPSARWSSDSGSPSTVKVLRRAGSGSAESGGSVRSLRKVDSSPSNTPGGSNMRRAASTNMLAVREEAPTSRRQLFTATIVDEEDEVLEEEEEPPKEEKKKRVSPLRQAVSRVTSALGFFSVKMKRAEAIEAIRAVCLPERQLRKLKRKFDMVDLGRSGTIETKEFFRMIREEPTPLTDYLFGVMNLDSSGSIEFEEFVIVLFTYCMYSKDDILRFCYDSFDADHSNSIDEREFTALLAAVNNSQPTFPGNFSTALQNFDTNQDGLIDFAEFKNIDKRFPLIFFPAFRLQDMMMKHTLGERAWRDIHRRVERQRSVNEYRKLHGVDPPAFFLSRVYRFFIWDNRARAECDVELVDAKKPSLTSALIIAKRKEKFDEASSLALNTPTSRDRTPGLDSSAGRATATPAQLKRTRSRRSR